MNSSFIILFFSLIACHHVIEDKSLIEENPIHFLYKLKDERKTVKSIKNFNLSRKSVFFLSKEIYSAIPCHHVINDKSSILTLDKSTIGDQALYLILGHMQKQYPPYLTSKRLTKVDKIKITEWLKSLKL